MGLPNDFYTVSTLFTLSGSSTAIWIITGVLGDLFKSKMKKTAKKWVALTLSFVFAFVGATLIPEKSILVWVVAFVNGFLIYLTSVGLNTISSKENARTRHPVRPNRGGGSSFFESWW